MDPSQTDLEAIRRTLAELTTRIYRIEQRLQIAPDAAEPRHAEASISSPPSAQQPRVPLQPAPDTLPGRPVPTRRQPEIDLESRIGSHWLNRIGIAALLIGISYFLKFAFENNWIGPAGRVTIGLIAGIVVIACSERFRSRGYQAFSYSLKAVGTGA